jgi:glutamyl-tRNA synthetase
MEADCLAKLQSKPENAALLAAAATAFGNLPDTFTEDQAHEALNTAAAAQSVKPGALMPLLRAAFSGQNRGPGVTTIAHLLGKQKVLTRLTAAQTLLK